MIFRYLKYKEIFRVFKKCWWMCRGLSERMGINYRYVYVLIKFEINY